ncbi:DUF1573 domain-containing protein [Flavobacterium sp. NRK F10]|uniref:DUF1573 domain-containing protein n=1 Tax=Flavobacterium sediminis TaxID=2201181 RepID=A0A2U8QU22_9FLAO|nr:MULTISPECIES: DUF1573 domain-containing protein [Flavobacterium]AWM13690.1 DUF1573 domain-containing protein [Flavobacterium sediminis]MCO6174819.1 DUF1573 domain-containing protein [Flavobacterium sp. NRK F10]
MKALKLSLVALFVSALSFAQTPATAKKMTVQQKPAMAAAAKATKQSDLKWDNDTHDFGEIEKGKPVSYEFTFTNTSKQTILVTNVKPSCGCTATNYTKTPVKPGEKGSVTATYNAAHPGNFHKTVTVTTNEEGAAPKVLIIKGTVQKPETEEKSILLK